MSRHPHEVRLIDQILSLKLAVPYNPARYDEATLLRKIQPIMTGIPQAVPVVADDVAEYYYAISDKEMWGMEDIPKIMPPFPVMWVETVHPSFINSPLVTSENNKWEMYTPHRWGALLRLVQESDDRFGVEAFMIEQMNKNDQPTFTCYFRLYCDAQGAPIDNQEVTGEVLVPVTIPLQDLFLAAFELLKPLLLAISFMHCKNVPLEVRTPPEKLVKARMKRGHPPLVTYRVINIEPFKQFARTARGKHGVTEAKQLALHMMRGHFKTYTAESPLMGRHVGTFWWHPHMRGLQKYGVVHKTYEVHDPKVPKENP